MHRNDEQRGFTLIELLVVIGIIVVLSVVVVLTLNPSELLRQARDSGRLSDLGTIKTAITLYVADSSNPNLASSSAAYAGCYLSVSSGTGTTTTKCGYFTNGSITTNVSSSAANYRKTDSTGWLPVNLSAISGGTPLSVLPIDPASSDPMNYYYAYAANSSLLFEIDARLESTKYRNSLVSSEGGNNTSTYEVGTILSL